MSIRGVSPLGEMTIGVGILIAGFVTIMVGVSQCGCTPAARAGTEAKVATAEAVTCALAHAATGKAAEAVAAACDVELEVARAIVAANAPDAGAPASLGPFLSITIPNCPAADGGAP